MDVEEWQEFKLEELVDSSRGISYGVVQPGEFLQAGGVPILKVNNLTEGKFHLADVYKISEAVEKKYSRTRLRGDEILVSLVGSLGHIFKVEQEQIGWNVVRAIGVLPIDKKFNREWIYWYLKSPEVQTAIRNRATHTVQATLNLKELKEITIQIPSKEAQEKITKILSTIEEKIELNRQTAQTLEAIAQTLFKEWFVDFNFPGATGEMEESELGMIPKGWRVGSLKDMIEVNPKLSIKKGAPASYVEMKDLSGTSMSVSRCIKREFSSGSKFQNGDILFARITPCLENGKTGFVDFLEDEEVGWGSTEFIVLRGKEVSPHFVYCLSRFPKFREYAIKSMVGSSGRQRVVESMLVDYPLVLPSKTIADSYAKSVQPLFESIRYYHDQAKTLIKLRDILLPKLMKEDL